jgi:hypothetical protein
VQKVINSFTSHKLLKLFENKFSTPFSIACHYIELMRCCGAKVASLSFKTIFFTNLFYLPNSLILTR